MVEIADDVAFRVEPDSVRSQRRLRRQYRFERLVLHVHEPAGIVGRGGALGRDRDDRLAGIADTIPGEHRRVLGQGPDQEPLGRDVRRGQHGADPGGGPGPGDVDVQETGMRMLASHEAAVEHSVRGEVGRVPGHPSNLVERVVAGQPQTHPGPVAVERSLLGAPGLLAGFTDDAVVLVLPVRLLFERAEGELLSLGLRPPRRHPLLTPAPRSPGAVRQFAPDSCCNRIARQVAGH